MNNGSQLITRFHCLFNVTLAVMQKQCMKKVHPYRNSEAKQQPAADNQMHLIKVIIRKREHLSESRRSGGLLVCSIQMCVNTMSRSKDISNNLRAATVDIKWEGLWGYFQTIWSPSFHIIFWNGKHWRQLTIFPWVDITANSPQNQSNISDSSGLS